MRTSSVLALLTISLAPVATARALPEYPAQLQKAADTPCLPHCSVCHRDDNAGSGTVDRPFGHSIEEVGGLGDGSMQNAVDRLRQASTDSDGDGTSDVDELAAGEDPNYSGDGDLCGPLVGCSATGRSDGSAPLGAAFAIAVAGVGAVLRRRARPRRPG